MPQEVGTFTSEEATELLQHIATNMVTKADVKEVVTEVVTEIVPPMIEKAIGEMVPPMINKAKHEIMDYVDKKDREYKGELNLALQKEDKKVDAVIDTLRETEVVGDSKSEQLKNLTPFPVQVTL
ncbi:MAG: hypothetical protein A2848_00595 [Candidatus Magasanikbacteria bacterium RIFCSPHIGHO2_01_FULL_50_8]|uniref:Uncharacterized protein n=2 Tax=Candidatus Magasanikiibacteriota TaxID=1752731 RepID=A0A1F6LS55_9BACT|nr:MAG: hypothetical protein A2848_00595 [Candidatus Magasanikbacteria bacterium RIFCSPHIGHO2_01_FULL_50_8]OGH67937.1 MAG: hypothetical protein A3C15_00175 [Candidatus Magasanikbacteria bacterium RIFCSPHIGHO2_02_FULL_50_9b]